MKRARQAQMTLGGLAERGRSYWSVAARLEPSLRRPDRDGMGRLRPTTVRDVAGCRSARIGALPTTGSRPGRGCPATGVGYRFPFPGKPELRDGRRHSRPPRTPGGSPPQGAAEYRDLSRQLRRDRISRNSDIRVPPRFIGQPDHVVRAEQVHLCPSIGAVAHHEQVSIAPG